MRWARVGGRVAGVDGCPAGWLACLVTDGDPATAEIRLVSRIADLIHGAEAPTIIAIDMPIGLPERIGPEGRGPERLVRPLLGERQSSVFSIPSRAAVFAGVGLDDRAGYAAACTASLATSEPPKKISKQAFHLFPKIRELDAAMGADAAGRVFESHPEVAFMQANDERPMARPKKVKSRPNPAGLAERCDLLVELGFARALVGARPPRGAGPDDLLDACILAWVAGRIGRGEARVWPERPVLDGRGLEMAIRA